MLVGRVWINPRFTMNLAQWWTENVRSVVVSEPWSDEWIAAQRESLRDRIIPLIEEALAYNKGTLGPEDAYDLDDLLKQLHLPPVKGWKRDDSLPHLEREVSRLREACRDLAARKEGEQACAVCSLPCYECDQTPAGYLCSRCCPHPDTEKLEALTKAATTARDLADAIAKDGCNPYQVWADDENGGHVVEEFTWREGFRRIRETLSAALNVKGG